MDIDIIIVIICSILIIVFLLSNIINYIFNEFEKTIAIKDKYIYNTYGRYGSSTFYNVVDTNNSIYNVVNVWFIGDFNRVEDYNLMNKGDTYKVKGYGFRVDFLGWYPTIYNVQKA